MKIMILQGIVKAVLFFLFFLITSFSIAGEVDQYKIEVSRSKNNSPIIDGKLDPKFWPPSTTVFKGTFTQFEPDNGAPASQLTEVKVTYSDFAIYIAAINYDNAPDSILTEVGLRDQWYKNADRFGVGIDTYKNGQNAFYFTVSAAGVQSDFFIVGEKWDRQWDAVWNSAVDITDDGWIVEIEIPYSALRFPKKDEQEWGINFMREIRRNREESYWKRIDNSRNGFVNQFGQLVGINNVDPPFRLSLTPFVTANYVSDQVNHNSFSNFTYGMDLKYGISESFTLDVSLIPDFSQVRSDNLILNLGPFEVRYDENRPFFTEGADLFEKAGLFYSRRIGQTFIDSDDLAGDNEEVIEKSGKANLINSVKFSGRNKKGLGIGMINSITDKTTALLEDEESGLTRLVDADPVTNFNILVLDQNLDNNSSISLINTNVIRGNGGRDANVTGTDFTLYDKSNTFMISGDAAVSIVSELNDDGLENTESGYFYNLNFGKVSGKYQFMMGRRFENNTYDPNDLGYLRNNNEITHFVRTSYQKFKPSGILNRFTSSLGFEHAQLYKPSKFQNWEISINNSLQFTNFWSMGWRLSTTPAESYNYNEPRVTGRFYSRPGSMSSSLWVGTDRRKNFSLRANVYMFRRPSWDQLYKSFGFSPSLRINDKLTFDYDLDYRFNDRSVGYVTKLYDQNDELDEIIFGRRDITTISNSFGGNLTFNSKMGLNMRMRHYWSQVEYEDYFDLQENGKLTNNNYNGLQEDGSPQHNKNFNAFNIDFVYSLQIAPGSFMSFVWKDSIITDDNDSEEGYLGNFESTMGSPHQNSFSLKLLYYLDYLTVKNQLNL